MKLPKLNINDSYPLTLGVSDDYFTLSTRLKRLGRAPMQPRRRAAWLLGGALLFSFVAVVPLRLTARAQSEEQPTTRYSNIAGVVRGEKGQPLADVTIYALKPRSRGEILETVKTDARGQFRFSDKVDSWAQLFADAGARGLGTLNVYSRSTRAKTQIIEVAPASRLKLRFIAGKKPVAGLKVRLWRIGRALDVDSLAALPPRWSGATQTTTDARGVATFGPLPAGTIAQFRIDNLDQSFGGRRFAQLVAEDDVKLGQSETSRDIQLMAPVSVVGRVTLPNGTGAADATVSASGIPDAYTTGITDDVNDDGYSRTATTDAEGNYRINGLHPGAYQISAVPDPQTTGVTRFSKNVKVSLDAPTTRADVTIARGGLVQGVVISQTTKQPVKGQTLILDSDGDREAVITDARGYFRFRPFAGPVNLEVHANGINSPPPGFVLPVKSKFDFTIKDGEKREFKIELPGKRLTKATSGIVVGLNGTGVAGAKVVYRDIARGVGNLNGSLTTDAQGRFALPAAGSKQIVQLFADKGDATTSYSTIASPGETVKLQLAPNAWSSIEGRVIDENKRPIAGVNVDLARFYGNSALGGDKTVTDENGQFRYELLRPNTSVLLQAKKSGYAEANEMNFTPLALGKKRRVDFTLRSAPKTLAGMIYDVTGKPARDYAVMASGQGDAATTDKNGRFSLPHVFAGQVSVEIYPPKSQSLSQWQPVMATGGDRNLVIRLANVPPNQQLKQFEKERVKREIQPESLVGKMAPPIRATSWSNERALTLNQLRDRPVFLTFGGSDFNSNEVRDLARSAGGRIYFVGVQRRWPGGANPKFDISADQAARKMGFPIAVDALISARQASGWQTWQSYGNADYVVIGRDGKVIYAGGKLDRAIELALASAPS